MTNDLISKQKLLDWIRRKQENTNKYPNSLCYEVVRNRWIELMNSVEVGDFND
jgi:hypothetical protein